jgi:hypothetical protein
MAPSIIVDNSDPKITYSNLDTSAEHPAGDWKPQKDSGCFGGSYTSNMGEIPYSGTIEYVFDGKPFTS